MLTGDYMTYQTKASQSGGSPKCRLCCTEELENIEHILSYCIVYEDIRNRIVTEYEQLSLKIGYPFEMVKSDNRMLCQFILDPTCMNLKSRLDCKHESLKDFLQISRDYCYAVHSRRMNQLKTAENQLI